MLRKPEVEAECQVTAAGAHVPAGQPASRQEPAQQALRLAQDAADPVAHRGRVWNLDQTLRAARERASA